MSECEQEGISEYVNESVNEEVQCMCSQVGVQNI